MELQGSARGQGAETRYVMEETRHVPNVQLAGIGLGQVEF